MSVTVDLDLQRLLRELAPQALASVVRRSRDFASAEDAVQEALIAAATQWPREGAPDNPCGWLIRVAARRMTDQLRADGARQKREATVVSWVPADEQWALTAEDHDSGLETLDLLFVCCDPTLSAASAIALTLRAVGGLTTGEIAKAFLVPEATMAQRIRRAKQTIKAAGSSFQRPSDQDRAARLGAVTHVLYLIFSEGYAVSAGPALQRTDLSNEALRLTRLLRRLVPDDCEVAGLLALMLLTDARREARAGPAGELVPLDQQDRSRWDRAAIQEGVQLISATLWLARSVSSTSRHRRAAR